MAKRKLQRFAENKTFAHLHQPAFDEIFQKDFKLKGKWGTEFFKNDNPIVLELGCGKGEYTIGLAQRYPEKNFIGVDIKGARLWRGAKTIQEENITNACFIRTRIDFITSFFAEGEVSEIWITFPDPQPRKNQARKRLTGPMFIDRYKQFLKKDGLMHLKSDSDFFFNFTLDQIEENGYQQLECTHDLYGEKIESLDPETAEILSIRTFYESKWLAQGDKIKYVKFKIG